MASVTRVGAGPWMNRDGRFLIFDCLECYITNPARQSGACHVESWSCVHTAVHSSACALLLKVVSIYAIVSGSRAVVDPKTSSKACRSAISTSAMVTTRPRSARLVTP